MTKTGMMMMTKCPGSFERVESVQFRHQPAEMDFWKADSLGEGPRVDGVN